MRASKSQRIRRAGWAFALALALCPIASAAKFTSAEITRVINEVRLLTGTDTSSPAVIGATVSGSTAVQTGQKSRAELKFPDKSIVRIGSNSVFSFLGGTRDVSLENGALLMQVPKSLGRTRIKTAAVSAAITGTTILFEYIPEVVDEHGNVIRPGTVKIIVIEGSLEYSLNIAPKQRMRLLPGEMAAFPTNVQALPPKFKIDLERLVKTSKLMDGGMGRLPELNEIDREVAGQNRDKQRGRLLELNIARNPKGRPDSPPSGGVRSIDRVRTAINGRPALPPPPPAPATRRPTQPAPSTAPLTAPPVSLPDRPDREPPTSGGTGGSTGVSP